MQEAAQLELPSSILSASLVWVSQSWWGGVWVMADVRWTKWAAAC